MKLETELKPGDIVLLKVLACILILFFTLRFLVFPGLEKNQDLQNEKEQVEQTKQEMQDTIKQKSIVEKKIVKQKAELVDASQGFYDLLENQQVDELVTGIALKHNLKPVYLKIEEPRQEYRQLIRLSHRRMSPVPRRQSLHRRSWMRTARSLRLRQIMNRKLSCSM